ncbi:hypothetical protein BUALT_Bualt09G0005400 [Buddleja alternifolia]|uniref:DUF4005 domain-containing protein n=1 Tax=Buddleja alternifolia TaxID=168488 RepID=A0AAV6X5F5_9LAMI|nr:hypothetical protein BUALT_Bualt09G0005400 [Buddleja alternifolia]
MGKKGSWFSAIKRVFTHSSKDKPTADGSDKKSSKEKKKGKGVLRHGETKSFIPLFREPSSIEKILGEADQLLIRPHASPEQPKTSPPLLERPTSPKAPSPKAASPRAISPKVVSPEPTPPTTFIPGASSSKAAPLPPKVTQSRNEISYVLRLEPPSRNQHLSATKIQAAYRGYLGRRNFRALRGLVRLQGVVRGQNVKRQTVNAMKQMQLLVRVQTQIQSRRIQMLENQAIQHQTFKEVESTLSKWTQRSESGENEDWDDSMLTKEEEEARLQKKVEAVIKRERAMAYAYSHQLWKSNPKSAQSPLDIRSIGFPWWWNWLERQLPPANTPQTPAATKNITVTPPRPISEYKPSPRLHATNYESLTPRSSKSAIPFRHKHFHTPNKSPNYSKPRASAANSAYDVPLNDNDSLTSCPPFSVPNYMTPTVSAKAKARAYSNPKERVVPGTPGNDSKRRFSFPMTPNIGSFKLNKGTNKDSASQKGVLDKHESSHSIGDFSVDSAVSMPAMVGRKPFNRFV